MTLQDKCTSLELSKRLKALGVPQEKSYFTWYTNGDEAELIHNPEGYRTFENKSFDAFISDELGRMLPISVLLDVYTLSLEITKILGFNNKYIVGYKSDFPDSRENVYSKGFVYENLAEALGLLVEYLIINGYLDPKEIKL